MRVIVAAAGTAGHINPALSIAKQNKTRGKGFGNNIYSEQQED